MDDVNATMMEAIEAGKCTEVVELLQAGANANHKNAMDGWGPVHLAAFKGHLDIVEVLIKAGGDPLAKTKNGEDARSLTNNSAIHAALESNQVLAIAIDKVDERCQMLIAPKAGQVVEQHIAFAAVLPRAYMAFVAITRNGAARVEVPLAKKEGRFQGTVPCNLPSKLELCALYPEDVNAVSVVILRSAVQVGMKKKAQTAPVRRMATAPGAAQQKVKAYIDKGEKPVIIRVDLMRFDDTSSLMQHICREAGLASTDSLIYFYEEPNGNKSQWDSDTAISTLRKFTKYIRCEENDQKAVRRAETFVKKPKSDGVEDATMEQKAPEPLPLTGPPTPGGGKGKGAAVETPSPVARAGPPKPGELCEECEEADATLFCEDCGEYFCDDCSTSMHAKGKRKLHTVLPRDEGGRAPPATNVAADGGNDPQDETLGSAFSLDHNELIIGQGKENLLGTGTFGSVTKGRWNGTEVAIKTLKFHKLDDKLLREFANEVAILGRLRHPNVILFMGASNEPPFLYIVTELMAGNLFSAIHKQHMFSGMPKRKAVLSVIQVCLDTARAMAYLHSRSPIVLHRDLKSLNVLRDDQSTVFKVTDFGLSKIKEVQAGAASVGTMVGTPNWMAPEVMMGKKYSSKVDVYSFGIMMFEMISSEIPFHKVDAMTICRRVSQDNARPQVARNIIKDKKAGPLVALMEECWDANADVRPAFDDIIRSLNRIKESV